MRIVVVLWCSWPIGAVSHERFVFGRVESACERLASWLYAAADR